ncbi:MAG: EcsC family protein [Rhodobacteraceae bacterium]|nr:EcsC family protein [Paracoccaceae bacterium]
MEDVVLSTDADVDAEIARLGARHKAAGGLGISLLNQLGARADGLLTRLPQPVRDGLTDATLVALQQAVRVADGSRAILPDQSARMNQIMGAGLGAAGGVGGLPSALAELPVTTTFLLRVIQGVAQQEGFNPREEGVRFDCVQVFASAGPLAQDDDADMGFLAARVALQGTAMQALLAKIAPRLATVLGQKIAAQSVPLLGAVAGASTNYVFTKYYTEMAHVHFGLRRLAGDTGVPPEQLKRQLAAVLGHRL